MQNLIVHKIFAQVYTQFCKIRYSAKRQKCHQNFLEYLRHLSMLLLISISLIWSVIQNPALFDADLKHFLFFSGNLDLSAGPDASDPIGHIHYLNRIWIQNVRLNFIWIQQISCFYFFHHFCILLKSEFLMPDQE